MTREEAVNRFKGIRESFSISIAQSKFYSSKAELNELCDMAIEALSADAVSLTGTMKYLTKPHNYCEVVRCKDCRWKEECSQFVVLHKFHGVYQGISFCSYGEKEDE